MLISQESAIEERRARAGLDGFEAGVKTTRVLVKERTGEDGDCDGLQGGGAEG
jgi:hypothetical protein